MKNAENHNLYLLKTARYALGLVSLVFLISIILLFIVFLVQFVANEGRYPILMAVVEPVRTFFHPLVQLIQMTVPYRFGAVDLSFFYLVIVGVILRSVVDKFRDFVGKRYIILRESKNYEDWRDEAKDRVSDDTLSELDEKFEEMQQSKTLDRKELVKNYIDLKVQLDSMGQQLAFLSIDVVDSTGMKQDEDKYLSSYDFDRYNALVIDILESYSVIKYAVTPDGIMCCFASVDEAVNAARDILSKLQAFNKDKKKIKMDFRIRAGINVGIVCIEEDMPLDKVSDQSIDIAGHMQKYAETDSINITESALKLIENKAGFVKLPDKIDEQLVFQWKKEDAQTSHAHLSNSETASRDSTE